MKARRLFAFVIALLLLTVTALSPMSVYAVTYDNETHKLRPGNIQSTSPVYSMAWLDKVVIRDDATAIKAARLVPQSDYPYSKTYEAFVEEVGDYAKLKSLDEETAASVYNSTLELFFYAAAAMGMTDEYDAMFSYLCDYGIRMPETMTANDKVMVSAVYAAIKYNAVYVLYGKNVSIPKGTTLEGAAVNILAALTATPIPSGINTVSGLGILVMKNYIEEIDEIPLTPNPDNEEVFHWIKAVTASAQDYQIPMISYDEASDIQKEYVDYAYYASIFDTAYDVHINPFALQEAELKADETAIPKLILMTMLNEKGVDFDENSSCEKLFDLACQNGGFNLDEEFYGDIYNYDLYVKEDCEKLWFTPFALADQLGGDNKYISIDLAGKTMNASATNYVPLDKSKKTETVTMEVVYNDGLGVNDAVTYTFNVIKVKSDVAESESDDLLVQVQNAIESVIPEDNEKANGIVDSIFSAVTTTEGSSSSTTKSSKEDSTLSTYATTSSGYTGQAEKADSGVDFSYLAELFDETYSADETAVSSYNKISETTTEQTIAEKTAEAIKENPEIVVAPTSIVAVGGLVGYFLTKKRKPSEFNEDESDVENF